MTGWIEIYNLWYLWQVTLHDNTNKSFWPMNADGFALKFGFFFHFDLCVV